jgi:creatinine amidohydrolase
MIFTQNHFAWLNKHVLDYVVVLPLGAVEQHGPHLSVSTDTDIVTAIAKETEARLPDYMLLCPTLPFGSSHHHLSFGGTISISVTTYAQVVAELVESLMKSGFRRILLLNGHGGNIIPVKQSLVVLSNKYDVSIQPNIALVTYWELAGEAFSGLPPMESPALSHACEYETSLMLHLFPQKVFEERIARANKPQSNEYIPWEDDKPYRGVTMCKQTSFISDNGSSGEPQLATAEKGKHLFGLSVNALTEFIKSFKTWPLMNDLSNEKPKQ